MKFGEDPLLPTSFEIDLGYVSDQFSNDFLINISFDREPEEILKLWKKY